MKIRIFAIAAVLLLAAFVARPSDGKEKQKSVKLKVLTYNVCGLPDFITSERGLIVPAKKRLSLIARLIKGYDIIGLQEMFIPDRLVIEKKLKTHFMANGTVSPKVNPTGSGIYVFSKGVIQRSIYERWREQYGVDAFSHKGFVGVTTIMQGGLEVDVYSLHAQAGHGPEARIDNYAQLLDGVKRFSKGTGRPILMIGDFNCEAGEQECDWLLEHSDFTHANPHLVDVDNMFFDENDSGWKITVESINWVYDQLINGKRISDHLGLEAVIRFDK